jgi:hypothetical protein
MELNNTAQLAVQRVSNYSDSAVNEITSDAFSTLKRMILDSTPKKPLTGASTQFIGNTLLGDCTVLVSEALQMGKKGTPRHYLMHRDVHKAWTITRVH